MGGRTRTIILDATAYPDIYTQGSSAPAGAVPAAKLEVPSMRVIASAPQAHGLRVLVKVVSAQADGAIAFLALAQGGAAGPLDVGTAFQLQLTDPPTEFHLEPGEVLQAIGSVPGVTVSSHEAKWCVGY